MKLKYLKFLPFSHELQQRKDWKLSVGKIINKILVLGFWRQKASKWGRNEVFNLCVNWSMFFFSFFLFFFCMKLQQHKGFLFLLLFLVCVLLLFIIIIVIIVFFQTETVLINCEFKLYLVLN